MTPALWIALGCFVLAAICAVMLVRGAKDGEVPVSPARVGEGNERYPRLRAVSPVSDDHARLEHFTARPFSQPAAKGFDRDAVIGRDVVSRAERQWTQPMTRKEMN